jgi:hypothetical protein
MKENREAYQRQIEAELMKWDEEVRKFKAKTEQARIRARIQYMDQIEKLKEKVRKVGGETGQVDSRQRCL